MNKSKYLLIFGIVGAIFVAGIVLFLFRGESATKSLTQELKVKQEVQNDENYKIFTGGDLTSADNSSKRVLFFYANWCPTCRPVDAEFSTNSNSLGDIEVIRINYNDSDTDEMERELAKKYGVTYQHTFVQIDSAGVEVKKWNGGGKAEVLNNVER